MINILRIKRKLLQNAVFRSLLSQNLPTSTTGAIISRSLRAPLVPTVIYRAFFDKTASDPIFCAIFSREARSPSVENDVSTFFVDTNSPVSLIWLIFSRQAGAPVVVTIWLSQPKKGRCGPFLDPVKVERLPQQFGPAPIHRYYRDERIFTN